MATSQTFIYSPESQSLPPINNLQSLSSQHISHNNGFPMLAVALLGISTTTFILVSYYIFVTNCCSRWQPLIARFSIIRRPITYEGPPTSYSPSWHGQGLNELLIRELPTFQFNKHENDDEEMSNTLFSRCVVCLNEFQDQEMLRVLPKCNHTFHLDCIDVWLQGSSNCPLCRSAISGRNRYWMDQSIVAPNSSPQDLLQPLDGSGEFVEIELSEEDVYERDDSGRFLVASSRSHHSSRKFEQKRGKTRKAHHHVSIMGDEGIDFRERDDERFRIQPIRRSFSMDSAADRIVYLSVQEILRHNRRLSEVMSNNGESSIGRSRRSIFSFGNERGSRNSVLPL